MKSAQALLILEDGTVFEGTPFAKVGRTAGETVFYTGVVGYQEVITDPSYAGTITVLTYPIIGSYGVNAEDNERADVHVSGVVLRRYSRHISNFRATGKLEEFLVKHGVVGIEGVDTRAVAVHLREQGEMKGMIVPGDADPKEAVKKLRKMRSPWETDLVKDLGTIEPVKPAKAKVKIVVLDLGVKRSTLVQFAELGCAVKVLPASASVRSILATRAKGLLLAGGPGDPQVLGAAVATVKSLLGRIPILGIGSGQLILALALDCGVRRMKTGHHGLNYPVKRTDNGATEITTQAHSFTVDEKNVSAGVEVTHLNVNDRTIEGIRSRKFPTQSVQFQPTTDEMGKPNPLFAEFVKGL